MTPSYRFATPAGEDGPRLLRGAYYSPRDAQNLVATLDGWINRRGVPNGPRAASARPRHARARAGQPAGVPHPARRQLARDANKELSDVGKSSIDTVWLGNPHSSSSRAGSCRFSRL